MDAIDFSPKHDFLIRHEDGTLTPMDEPYYESVQLNEASWQIRSSGDYHYLITGDEFGAAIDTGYGAGNLREYLEDLCGMPVPWVINTHHHFDHTCNNLYFDRAYMAKEAVPLASIPYPSFEGIRFPAQEYPRIIVGDGDVIPLPGRELSVFRIGDHTEDGIALLDRRYRMLFVGDEIMLGFKVLNLSVTKWKNDFQKLMDHTDEFDVICGGGGMIPKEDLTIFYEAACRILAGEPSDPAPAEEEEEGSPFAADYDDEGHVIYSWKGHPEDVPEGGLFKQNPNMEDYYYKGHKFTYDKTLL